MVFSLTLSFLLLSWLTFMAPKGKRSKLEDAEKGSRSAEAGTQAVQRYTSTCENKLLAVYSLTYSFDPPPSVLSRNLRVRIPEGRSLPLFSSITPTFTGLIAKPLSFRTCPNISFRFRAFPPLLTVQLV